MGRHDRVFELLPLLILFASPLLLFAQDATPVAARTQMPNGKLLGEVPGNPQRTNNFPTATAISRDGRYAVLLHSGYGAYTSGEKQSISVLNLETNALTDFPDERLGSDAKQTYFHGLAFSRDGKHLYASMASLTDPLGKEKGSTGNGIAVYAFDDGNVMPERFIALAPRTVQKMPDCLRREPITVLQAGLDERRFQ